MQNFRNIALSALLGVVSFASLAADYNTPQGNAVYSQQGRGQYQGQSYQGQGGYNQGGYQGQGGYNQGGYQGQAGYQDGSYQGQPYQGQGYYQDGNQPQVYQGQSGYNSQRPVYQDQGDNRGQPRGYYQDGGSQGCPNQSNRSNGDSRNQTQYGANDTSNEAVAARVRTALQNDSTLSSARTVQVAADEGKVTLTGTVKNEDEKSKAETIAKKVSGVKSVSNNITVAK